MIPRSQNGVAVKCHGLKKTYGEGTAVVQALRQVDLEIRTGELLMLVGPSGCGKTTLISIIAGILDQSDGDCLVFDQDFKNMRVGDKTRLQSYPCSHCRGKCRRALAGAWREARAGS